MGKSFTQKSTLLAARLRDGLCRVHVAWNCRKFSGMPGNKREQTATRCDMETATLEVAAIKISL
jgi:hypothetical protein